MLLDSVAKMAEILDCATMRKRYGTPLGAFRTLPISFSALANVSCLRLTHWIQTDSPLVRSRSSRTPQMSRPRSLPSLAVPFERAPIVASPVIGEDEALELSAVKILEMN